MTVLLDKPDPNWLSNFKSKTSIAVADASSGPSTRNRNNFNYNQPAPANGSVSEVLFHEATLFNDNAAPMNSTLRRLDQSWRLSERNHDEVIVVARLNTAKGLAEEVLTAKNTVSPTLIWLKELPGEGKPRPPVKGMMKQDTYIRIYVPINR